ncbi:MAG: hydroxymethylglutaryl-CoA lyase [Candidatus Aenigmarchaeota archaeon]|nr:hydroxymethylglutaryl-CoA lyase [Candidatus Aenigmarchaeota archaeon]
MPVNIYEVGPRDGLQSMPKLATETKIKLINKLAGTGLKNIEVGSFVDPDIIPQMVDIKKVIEGIGKSNSCYSVLIPNHKYYKIFRKFNMEEKKIKEIGVFVSASEKHNEENVGMSIEESMKTIGNILAMAKNDGLRIRGYISTAFGYIYDDVSLQKIIEISKWYLNNGVYQISYGDTIGIADIRQVRVFTRQIVEKIPADRVCLHLHSRSVDWRDKIMAAYGLGIRCFDSSIAGFGGCPTDPHIGNIPTEDLVEYIDCFDATNTNKEKIQETAHWIKSVMPNRF